MRLGREAYSIDHQYSEPGDSLKTHDTLHYYSKYPEIERLTSKTAAGVIGALKSIMARHGIPDELVSDNMPFGSEAFRQFAHDWGFIATTSSPRYPQSNGQSVVRNA